MKWLVKQTKQASKLRVTKTFVHYFQQSLWHVASIAQGSRVQISLEASFFVKIRPIFKLMLLRKSKNKSFIVSEPFIYVLKIRMS